MLLLINSSNKHNTEIEGKVKAKIRPSTFNMEINMGQGATDIGAVINNTKLIRTELTITNLF